MLWDRISIRAKCTTLCDTVCQWLATGRCFPPGPPVSYINKTTPPRYNWNIVENAAKHHKTQLVYALYTFLLLKTCFNFFSFWTYLTNTDCALSLISRFLSKHIILLHIYISLICHLIIPSSSVFIWSCKSPGGTMS